MEAVMTDPDMEQRPETAGRMADEDRAQTSRILAGCGWLGLGLIAVAVAVAWRILG